MKHRVADLVASFLAEQGVRDIFTLTGGGAMFLNDGLAMTQSINVVCNHHEQACAMAAVGYGKYKNGLAAVMLTTGCGATNALTGLLDAWQDNVPVIFISGQVKRKETSRNASTKLRQFGVQEVDIVSIVEPITKYSVMVNDPDSILYHLEKAVHTALNGRQGPVWIDIPLDVQGALVEDSELRHFSPEKQVEFDEEYRASFIERYERAEMPIIIAGNGVRLSGAIDTLRNFARQKNIPCVVTYLGVDYFEQRDPVYVGRIGIKGDRAGNFAVQNSDLIICLGTRLGVTHTGYEYDLFAREAEIVVVDIDKDEHQKNTVTIDQFIHSDVECFLSGIENKLEPKSQSDWQRTCIHWKTLWPVYEGNYDNRSVNMYECIKAISELMDENSVVVSDAGSSFYVTSQSLLIKSETQRYITSGAQADMGYTVPAAIGVCVASGKKPVIAVTGDGSFQLNIQELQTIKHHNYPIKLFVWNNKGYLSIRATQDKFFEGRRVGTDAASGISFPEVERIATAYCLPYIRVENSTELMEKLKRVLEMEGPVVCEVICPEHQEVIPTLSSVKGDDGTLISRPPEDMYPFISRDELVREMIVDIVKE